ncbi:hypothetical protein BDV18DRAFT_155305 [Aspergillus unguis]
MANSTLSTFQSALSTLYGPLDPSSIQNPSTWTPPQASGGHKGRYLWTDAFGVLCFITLHKESTRLKTSKNGNEGVYLTLASRLISTVHDVLGYNRAGTSRLPGATDSNPLGGGLRIGKYNEGGMDGDGQYHHYLTLWMFALNRMSLATNNPAYNQQAISLAKAIHNPFFVNRSSERPRMVWKMDMNLQNVLVGSEGHLDAIDGFIVCRILQAVSSHFGGDQNVLKEEIEDYVKVMKRRGEHHPSSDTLDLGMTLWSVHWFADEEWAKTLADRCFERLYDLIETDQQLARSTKYRLAFREFGTALGAKCMAAQENEKERAGDLKAYGDQILEAWKINMEASLSGTPEDLKPITRVMYAAALIPGAFQRGYLGPEPVM